MKLWKSLLAGNRSASGNITWRIGEWQTHEGEIVLCGSGFHASPTIQDAIGFVAPGVIASVEVRGDKIADANKSVHRKMRVLRTWPWTQEASVRLAVYAAELVVKNFERKYPDDNRPRAAIAAATAWLADPTAANARAAYSAAASAYSAASAADRAAASAAYRADSAEREKVSRKIHQFAVSLLIERRKGGGE